MINRSALHLKTIVTLVFVALTLSMGIAQEDGVTDLRGRASEIFSDPQVRALAEAAEKGNTHKMERLIKQGVNVNGTGRFGVTPLWWAIRTKNKTSFSYLLAHGAQPNPKVDTITVMEMAAGYEDSGYLEAVLPYKPDLGRVGSENNNTPLETAISQRQRHNLELLIKAGADLNTDDLGELPLELAAADADYDYVYLMLQAGADPTKMFTPKIGGPQKNRLATSISTRLIDPNCEEYEWRERVIAFLRARGIEANRPLKERPRTEPLPPDLDKPAP
jgi:hypothetical protein